ncbi:MAG: AlpA family phage regulatory protein [Betaproteobacteria bacterium]|nr:AlpA family phage regulatory protein [Betaproteobacteria bacterium]
MAMTVLRLPSVLARKGDSRSKTYSEIAAGLWPPGVAIGRRARGWPEHECEAILRARIAGKSDSEIRELVKNLMAARTATA